MERGLFIAGLQEIRFTNRLDVLKPLTLYQFAEEALAHVHLRYAPVERRKRENNVMMNQCYTVDLQMSRLLEQLRVLHHDMSPVSLLKL